MFAAWSDAGLQAHNVIVGASPITITGTFTTQYLLTTAASPGNGGSVTQVGPFSNGPYYDAGTLVTVFEQPSLGFVFTNWSGACSGAIAWGCSPRMVPSSWPRPGAG